MAPPNNFSNQIKAEASRLGFDAIGIARLTPSPTQTMDSSIENPPSLRLWERLKKWLDWGFHGTMEWMEKNPKRRSNPTEVLPGCQSLIMVGMNYFTDYSADESKQAGRIARYAWGQDYHRLFKIRLVKLEEFLHAKIPGIKTKSYVDTGPIMEKPWAQEAGIGWIGKHTNLVSTDFGSWLLLGEILTTAAFEYDEPALDLCGTCSLCIQACPTGAIVEPYILDAEKCISYLTIEYRGSGDEISVGLQKKIGNRIFGCDDCLDICPFNINAQPTSEEGFRPLPWTLHPELPSLVNLNKEEFGSLTNRSPIRRTKHEGFIRNVQWGIKNIESSDSSR